MKDSFERETSRNIYIIEPLEIFSENPNLYEKTEESNAEFSSIHREERCDGFCPDCDQTNICDVYDEFWDEWKEINRMTSGIIEY